MTDIDLKKHYLTFKWAVSENWRHKNWLYKSIQQKVNSLKEEYGLSERDVVDELFANYWERGHYQKYDPYKGSLNNWIARYVNLYMNHLIRRCAVRAKDDTTNQRIDPLDQRNWSNIVWIDRVNVKEDPDYQPEILFHNETPEQLVIRKERFEFACDHFSKIEMSCLIGKVDMAEAAEITGISYDAFRKRIERRAKDFITAMDLID